MFLFPRDFIVLNEGCFQNARLADGIPGCQSPKSLFSRSSDPLFCEGGNWGAGAGVTCLRPPRGAWRGQERGSGFSRDGRSRLCAAKRRGQNSVGQPRVCVSVWGPTGTFNSSELHITKWCHSPRSHQTKSYAGCKRGLAEGAISQKHPIPQVAGRWPWHKGGHTQKKRKELWRAYTSEQAEG